MCCHWLALTYAGDLPCDALFWNGFGVMSSMNGLYPTQLLYGGLGRNFMSRDVLGARSVDDAISRLTVPNQATGHNFNIMSLFDSAHRLLNIEVLLLVVACLYN